MKNTIYLLLMLKRKQTSGRWVFPLVLVLYVIFHYLYLFQISFPWWDSFTSWFVKLPLT
jgi:putative effector of murein hydrolase